MISGDSNNQMWRGRAPPAKVRSVQRIENKMIAGVIQGQLTVVNEEGDCLGEGLVIAKTMCYNGYTTDISLFFDLMAVE